MNGLKKYIASNNLNRSNSMHVSKNNETKLDPKIAEILDSSLRQNSFLKPKKAENERTEHSNSPAPCFGQAKPSKTTFQEPTKDIQEGDDLFEDCAKAIAILNKYRNKVEPEINMRKLQTSVSHFSRDTEANSREEPKSYAQLWKEGKDTREICKDKNALYSIIYENELLGNNTYLRQHLNRRIRSSAAALIIQKWFRDNSSGQKGGKRSESPKHPKQDWVGVLSSNKGNLDSRIKKRQARRDNKSRCYEYEELETENGSLPMRHDHSGQKKILEEVSIQLKGNSAIHSGKKKKNISATKKNKGGDKENFSLLETDSRSNNQKPLKGKAERRNDSLERMLGIEESFSSDPFEIAAIQIQRAFRKYLLNKQCSRNESIESIKKLNQKNSFERKNQQEKEYLSLELKNSQKIIADLQQENENLKYDLVDLENNIEKKIEERVGIEKTKFKGLLDQYTQFIDRLLQEKVDITQYYEVLTTSNQEMKERLQKYEEKDYEKIIANLEAENQKLEDERSQLLQEAETFRENNHSSLLREVVQNLENENETLKTKIHEFINEKEGQFNEVNEANSRLLQKLRSSEVYIAELEEKLEISENRCKNLMEQSKNSNLSTNVGSGTVESLKSRIYIPRAMPENFISDDLIIKQQQNNTYTPGKFDEDYILSVRNNTESETQSIPETHRDQKPSLPFKLVESECDLAPDSAKMSTDRLVPPETSQHLEFSFEAKDSAARSRSESENNHSLNQNNNVIIESFEVDPAEADSKNEENFGNKEINRVQADFKIFEYRKMSQEYFSGKFVDEAEPHSRQSFEDNQIQEQALDEEDQSLEINLLIENISKKLELAKLNRDGEGELNHEIKFTKTLSLPKFEEAEERSPLYRESNKARNLSQTNLHQNGLLFEEEAEEEDEQEKPEIDLPLQKQPNNFKKGVLDTLKKADLLFGRANI